MKFSIIMASYNQVTYIQQAIDSVLDQTYENFELIIIDGMSNDGTLDIINKYKNHPKVKLTIEKDTGLYHARNKGILSATGEIIGFLNTDDFYTQDALANIHQCFQENPGVDVVYGLNTSVNKKNEVTDRDKFTTFDKVHRMKKYIALPDQSTFILSKNINYVGLYDCTFKIVADWDFWQRGMTLNLKFISLDKYIGNFRKYDETLTFSSKFENLRFKGVKRLYNRYNDALFSSFFITLHFRYYVKRPLKKIVLIEKIYRLIKK
jgi:glycosyltransferase involved in cell wall biosynthesis